MPRAIAVARDARSGPISAETVSTETSSGFRVSDGYRHYVVWLLCIVYALNMLDRSLLGILMEPIKGEFKLSDSSMGLLGGPAFALFYTTLGMPLARLSDRTHRPRIIAWSIIVWSMFTAATGFARSFAQLLVARVGVAVGEAGCNPAAYSLIGDYVEPKRRGTALAIYGMGASVGTLVGLIVGGFVAQTYGWRTAFLLLGLPGAALALVLKLTLKDPPRGFSDPGRVIEKPPPALRVLSTLWSKPAFRHLSIAAALHNFAIYGIGNFSSSFLIRSHHMNVAEAGYLLAGVTFAGGFAGTYIGGAVSDRLADRRQDSRYYLWTPAVFLLLGFPLSHLVYALDDMTVVTIMMVLATGLGAGYLAPNIAATYRMVGIRERALASALLLLILNLIGLGLGPLLCGMVSDLLNEYFVAQGLDAPTASAQGLLWALLLTLTVNLWSALHYFLAARTLRRDSIAD